MHPTSNTALAYALGTHPEPNGRGSAGSFIMSSTMTLGLFLAGALGASAQDLTGTYLYQPSGGTVTLELQQSGGRLTGVLRGIDGTVNRLDGTFEDGRAIGTIYLTHGVGWFAVAAWGDGVRLLAAAIDPDTGTPDLSDGWQLDFTRASANGSGVSSTGGTGAGMQGGAGSSGESRSTSPPSSTPLVQEWVQHLAGKKVTYIDSYGDQYGGYSNRWEAYLCRDGTFHFRSSSNVNVDVGGAFGHSRGGDSFSGRWRIVEYNGKAILQYQREHEVGTEQGEWVALGYQNGATYFDSNRVYVTEDNTMCW